MSAMGSLSPVFSSIRSSASQERGPEGYSTLEVSGMCGVSLRQLQWWDEADIVRPHVIHPHRRYAPVDVTKVSIVRALRDKNEPMHSIRRALIGFRLPRNDGEVFLMIVDGKRYVTSDARKVIQRMKRLHGGAVVIALSNEYGLWLAERPAGA